MARVYITEELADTVKSLRHINKLRAKDLAAHIGKSPSYITKLEKGDIVTVSEEELESILSFITKEKSANEKMIEKIYKTLKYKFSDEDIEKQVWFSNFDTVGRKVPIPQSLIDVVNDRMTSIGVTREYLLTRVNANEALPEAEVLDPDLPFNTWYAPDRENMGARSIKMKLSIDLLNGILDKTIDRTSYVYLLAIVTYLLKIEKYGDQIDLAEEDSYRVMELATDLLDEHKFYSITSKSKLLSEADSLEERQRLLSTFDRDNIKIVNEMLAKVVFMSEIDVKKTNEDLSVFNSNLDWDVGFMFKLIGMNYNELNQLSHTKRKHFLDRVEDLISEYKDLPVEQGKVELY